jgi:hypothetical protein
VEISCLNTSGKLINNASEHDINICLASEERLSYSSSFIIDKECKKTLLAFKYLHGLRYYCVSC